MLQALCGRRFVDARIDRPRHQTRQRDRCDGGGVAWSSIVNAALEAAEIAARQSVSAEVIDLRSLWPWDEESVVASARRTGRLVIAQEAVTVCGFGAEIAATIAGRGDVRLRAPIRRVGAPRVPVPFSPPLEDAQRVTAARIAAALAAVAGT
jgi:pyruvate dehydrogenase E1 component beta subunit